MPDTRKTIIYHANDGTKIPIGVFPLSGGMYTFDRPGRPVAVTPSDETVYDPPLTGFMVAVAGDVKVSTDDDDGAPEDQILPVVAGAVYPFWPIHKIYATDTTATGIIGIK